MDAIDRKILAVLQQDASLSVAEIGSRVGLSSTPCWKRIQRLEADGVITKRVALIDPGKIGLGITVFVSIETGDHSQEWLDRFAEAVGAMPEVMEFYRMAGDVDYMLRVVVPDIAGYDTFYKKLIGDGAAEERDVALRDGEDQVDDGAADPVVQDQVVTTLSRVTQVGQPRTHVDLVLERQRAADDIADRRLVGVSPRSRSAKCWRRRARPAASPSSPTARAVPLSVSLQATVALPLASISMLDTVILSLASNTAPSPPRRVERIGHVGVGDVRHLRTRSATVRAVSVTLRSAPMPCEISTPPR